jgi:hypothetical protein
MNLLIFFALQIFTGVLHRSCLDALSIGRESMQPVGQNPETDRIADV